MGRNIQRGWVVSLCVWVSFLCFFFLPLRAKENGGEGEKTTPSIKERNSSSLEWLIRGKGGEEAFWEWVVWRATAEGMGKDEGTGEEAFLLPSLSEGGTGAPPLVRSMLLPHSSLHFYPAPPSSLHPPQSQNSQESLHVLIDFLPYLHSQSMFRFLTDSLPLPCLTRRGKTQEGQTQWFSSHFDQTWYRRLLERGNGLASEGRKKACKDVCAIPMTPSSLVPSASFELKEMVDEQRLKTDSSFLEKMAGRYVREVSEKVGSPRLTLQPTIFRPLIPLSGEGPVVCSRRQEEKEIRLPLLSYGEFLTPEIYYQPRRHGEGYYFRAQLRWKNKRSLLPDSLKNFIFIIDSFGVKQDRYLAFKRGVEKALTYLKEGDRFSLLLIGPTIDTFSLKPVTKECTEVVEAQKFLEEASYQKGTFHHPISILEEATQFFSHDRHNVVVLLSDGHPFSEMQKYQQEWLAFQTAHGDHFSLFTAAIGDDNHSEVLRLLAAFHGGELVHSPTNVAFPRKCARLIRYIHSMVARKIRVFPISHAGAGVEVYPCCRLFSNLYSDVPYTIYGVVETLEDFDLVIRGEGEDGSVDICCHILFDGAKGGGEWLASQVERQRAYTCYHGYFLERDPLLWNDADYVLRSRRLPPVFR